MSLANEYKLGEEQIHEVLSNRRRKRTLEVLKQQRDTVELRALAEQLAELESGESPPPRKLRQSVYNSLHQTHLPKLDELGIIAYDDDRKTVELRSAARTVDLYMEVLTPYGITWSTYYRTIALLSLLGVVADQLDGLFLSGDFTLLIASFFLIVIALSTGYQLWSNQWLHLRGLLDD